MIDTGKLEKVRRYGTGKIVAKCPACAEEGRDHGGEHLVIFPGGKFACIVNEGDAGKEHRKRIFELVGVVTERSIPSNITPKSRFRTGRTGISYSRAYGGNNSHIHIKGSATPSEASGACLYALRSLEPGQPPQLVQIDRETGFPIIDGAITPF